MGNRALNLGIGGLQDPALSTAQNLATLDMQGFVNSFCSLGKGASS